MIIHLNPPLALDTVKRPGLAHFIIDYGLEADLMWVVFMDSDGACWTVPNPEGRPRFNWTMGRRKPDPAVLLQPAAPDEARAANVHRVFPSGSESQTLRPGSVHV